MSACLRLRYRTRSGLDPPDRREIGPTGPRGARTVRPGRACSRASQALEHTERKRRAELALAPVPAHDEPALVDELVDGPAGSRGRHGLPPDCRQDLAGEFRLPEERGEAFREASKHGFEHRDVLGVQVSSGSCVERPAASTPPSSAPRMCALTMFAIRSAPVGLPGGGPGAGAPRPAGFRPHQPKAPAGRGWGRHKATRVFFPRNP